MFSVLLAALTLLVAAFLLPSSPTDDSPRKLLAKARLALRRNDFSAAESLAQEVLRQTPSESGALAVLGDALRRQEKFVEAIAVYDRIPLTDPEEYVHGRCMAGGILMRKLKRLGDAEQSFFDALRVDSRNDFACRHLAGLLESTDRLWDARPFRLLNLLSPETTPQYLYSIAVSRSLENDTYDEAFWQEHRVAAPSDAAPLLALAELSRRQGKTAESVVFLKEALSLRPELVEPRVRLGRAFLELGRQEEFLGWLRELPVSADRHPGIWNLRGQWAADHGQTEAAARCYWEALRLDPSDSLACYQLGVSLNRLGREGEGKKLLDRSRLLQQYVQACEASVNGWNMETPALLADQLGLVWEAYAWWSRRATSAAGGDRAATHQATAQRRTEELSRLLEIAGLNRTLPETSPVNSLDLSMFPLPDPPLAPRSSDPGEMHLSSSAIRFHDAARQLGVDFSYYNGHDPERRQLFRYYYRMNGGGAAIADIDQDGWPDMYLTQGSVWPPREDQDSHLDRLYRNLAGDTFRDVSSVANLRESGFSQGVAAGDVNQDGLPDIYVANIGRNVLFINNGDGTFLESSLTVPRPPDQWTVSCLIADLNGDRLPELFDVNYLEGDDVYTRICHSPDGQEGTCSPAGFDGSPDRVFVNTGDGGFRDCSDTAGIFVPDGRGLGAIAADFRGTGKLDIFVANDLSPNFYFRNETPEAGGVPRFSEQAIPMGLAFDEQGAAQACMGVAAGDINDDQRLDLFVTNFFDESNTLYESSEGAEYRDATRAAFLREPSLKLLGFGTQFLDAELDGDLDLILTNGHVDDQRSSGEPCQMPPQLMMNDGRGRFAEVSASSLGPFFQGKYLGRGLSRGDLNRDGLDDVVISHLDVPVAVLLNATQDPGHFLSLRLVGTESERDAFGTSVTCTLGDRVRMQQLVAGDGFQASNERLIRFGLGAAEVVDKLRIRWPSGVTQEFGPVRADQQVMLIEGRSALMPQRP